MKKQLIFILLLIAGIAVLVFWLHRPSAVPNTPTGNQDSAADNLSNSTFKPRPDTGPSLPKVVEKPLELAYLAKVKALMLSENQPIEFYARVVDQNGTSVSGATLQFIFARVDEQKVKAKFPNIRMGDEQMLTTNTVYSDGNGWIKITGIKGTSIDLLSLSKDGYMSKYSGPFGMILYKPGGERTLSASSTITNAFDPKKGHIFYLWKNELAEPLVKVSFSVNVEPSGTNWYSCELFKGQLSSSANADFRFWFEMTKDSKGNPARRFRFQAANGGLQPDGSAYSYEAPAAGYEPEWNWTYEPFGRDAGTDATELMQKKFFLRARSGKIYAAITWHWSAETRVDINGYLNPAGSRNLEPDPEKLITDKEEIQRIDKATLVE